MVGCAADLPPGVEDCRVGELVGSWRVAPPVRRELVFVIDTHGDLPSGTEVASAAGTVARDLASGDRDGDGAPERALVDDELRVAVIASALDCSEPPDLIEWLPASGIGGEIDSFVMRVERAVSELPACSSSAPLAATGRFLAGQELSGVGPVWIDVLIITDEDELGADATNLLGLPLPEAYRLMNVSIVSPTPVELDPFPPDWDSLLEAPPCAEGAEGSPALLRAARQVESTGIRVAVGSSCAELWIAPLWASSPLLPELPRCVVGPAVPPAGDLTDCTLIERLDRTGLHARCADLPGRDPVPIAIDEEGFETCRVIQRRAGDAEPGWWLVRDELCWREREVEVELVAIEAEAASRIELRCGSIPDTESCE